MPVETIDDLRNARNYHRRAHMGLAKGLAKLEWAAEVVGRMNWTNAEEAVRGVRRYVLGDGYDGLPLCEIEREMAVKRHNSFVVLLAYQVVSLVIQRQLDGIVAESLRGSLSARV